MIIFIVFVALFTVVYGRVFCGWVCPQTIFMEMVFRKIEYLIEGDASEQKALNREAWSGRKIRIKFTKYLIFYLLSFLIANAFLSYIIGIDTLIKIVTEPISQHWSGLLAISVFSLVFFFVYAWFREQVCLIVCPYGRMQGVLLDKDSIVVAYDDRRGEPRAKFSKGSNNQRGDCIDCFECVRVCPTGIDIRNGTQLECINCTLCIDACNHIMEKIHQPKGLIRYASENQIRSGAAFRLTPRMMAYCAMLIVLITLESFLLATRSDLDATILRARGLLFNTEADGRISNLYNLKVINKTTDTLDITFSSSRSDAEIKIIGKPMRIAPGDYKDGQFFIIIPQSENLHQKEKFQIKVMGNGKVMDTENTTFLSPNSHFKNTTE
jgi:cytochrome c oxidase accessory protein FixG